MDYQDPFTPQIYKEEDFLNTNYVKVKELPEHDFYKNPIILFTRWESYYSKKDSLLKEKDKHTLKLIYWCPKSGRIIDCKYYPLEVIKDIEDSIEVIEKTFKPNFKDIFKLTLDCFKKRIEEK